MKLAGNGSLAVPLVDAIDAVQRTPCDYLRLEVVARKGGAVEELPAALLGSAYE